MHAADAAGARGRRRAPTSSGRCAAATCSCTTRTTRSRRRSRRSSSRPPATRTCSRSSRRCTAPAATRAGIVASLVKAAEAGQAGGRARRAEGALRRAGEHRTGPHAGGGGRARRVRPRRAEDARQDPARRAPGGRRHPPLLPRRHRQLQPEDRDDSTRTSGCSRPTPSSAPTSRELFNHLTGYSRQGEYRRLLVAPDAPARRRCRS